MQDTNVFLDSSEASKDLTFLQRRNGASFRQCFLDCHQISWNFNNHAFPIFILGNYVISGSLTLTTCIAAPTLQIPCYLHLEYILSFRHYQLIIMFTFSNYLKFDDLQFGYQPNVSTSMCTWIAVETISHFTQNGSDVFTCLMDMRKAFDTVQHSVLFSKLSEQGMPHILVRYLLTTYRLQRANVKWNNEASYFIDIGNGVKQGAVLSAVFYCVYTNALFKELHRLNIGCCIG